MLWKCVSSQAWDAAVTSPRPVTVGPDGKKSIISVGWGNSDVRAIYFFWLLSDIYWDRLWDSALWQVRMRLFPVNRGHWQLSPITSAPLWVTVNTVKASLIISSVICYGWLIEELLTSAVKVSNYMSSVFSLNHAGVLPNAKGSPPFSCQALSSAYFYEFLLVHEKRKFTHGSLQAQSLWLGSSKIQTVKNIVENATSYHGASSLFAH